MLGLTNKKTTVGSPCHSIASTSKGRTINKGYAGTLKFAVHILEHDPDNSGLIHLSHQELSGEGTKVGVF